MLWNDNYATGIAKIDEQHKELFRQIDILMDRKQADRIPSTLEFLGNYVVRHFNDEQVMHTISKYPKAEGHKKLHAAFMQQYRDMKRQYEESGDKLLIIMKINKVCIDWLKEHIMGQDKDFAIYYKSIKN